MKTGDIVMVRHRLRWGGFKDRGIGVLLKQKYCAYDPANSRWEILVDRNVEVCSQGSLSKM